MTETQGYKLAHDIFTRIDAVLGSELLKTSNQTVENFQEFIARTSRRDLLTKVAELIDEHIDTVLVVNEFGKHFADRDAHGVQPSKDVVAFASFHSFLKKTPSVAKAGVLVPPVSMTAGSGGNGRTYKVLGLLAALLAASA